MQCKNESCSNERKGTSAYCGDTCRTVYNRNKRNTQTGTEQAGTAPEQVTGTQPEQYTGTPTLQHYQDNPTMYAQRTNPTLLNWGRPMSMHQLEMARLKANRVPIPGDHDYSGCCEQVDGKWQVKSGD